jgi:hypothetical protein
MDKLPVIECFPAAEFVCDACGKNSYVSLISVSESLSAEELKDFYKKTLGNSNPPEEAKAGWYGMPNTVKCAHCKAEYLTFAGMMSEPTDMPEFDND